MLQNKTSTADQTCQYVSVFMQKWFDSFWHEKWSISASLKMVPRYLWNTQCKELGISSHITPRHLCVRHTTLDGFLSKMPIWIYTFTKIDSIIFCTKNDLFWHIWIRGACFLEACMKMILRYHHALLHLIYIFDIHLSTSTVRNANIHHFYAKNWSILKSIRHHFSVLLEPFKPFKIWHARSSVWSNFIAKLCITILLFVLFLVQLRLFGHQVLCESRFTFVFVLDFPFSL